MPRPSVLVVALPYVTASALAYTLRKRGSYDVYAPRFAGSDTDVHGPFDAVITSVRVPGEWGGVILELPSSFDRPVVVRLGDLAVAAQVDPDAPIDGVIALLDRHLRQQASPR